jgi:tRNA(Ile)-lysidine synthase
MGLKPRPLPYRGWGGGGRGDTTTVQEWHGEPTLNLPQLNGELHFTPAFGQGISQKKLHAAQVTIRLRQGGERLRLHEHGTTRTLKNLLQEHGIPPWQRDTLPLLFCGETLVAVPGIGVAYTYQAKSDEAGMVLKWHLQGNGNHAAG